MMKVEIYMDRAGEFRWRLVARNGRIMADSSEGYTERHNARRAFRRTLGGLWQAWTLDEVHYL